MAKHADRMAGEGKRRGGQVPSALPPPNIPDPYNWKHGGNDGHMNNSSSDQSDPNCAISLTSNESGRYGMPSMNGHPRGGTAMSDDMLYSVESQKNGGGGGNNNSAASAFTPIQSLPGLPAGNSPSAGHRAYFPYGESFNFTSPGKTGTSAMDMKVVSSMDIGKMSNNGSGNNAISGGAAFPNQLIALHQIRNYATMPGGGNGTSSPSSDVGQSNNNNGGSNKEK